MRCFTCGKTVSGGSRTCSDCGSIVMPDPGGETVSLGEAEEVDALGELLGNDTNALRAVVANELSRDYEVIEEIGRGGMAVVYRAREVDLDRIVALKVLLPELALGSTMADRFKREARMAAALDHPNIIPIYRVGQAGRILYIAMKIIEGRVLDSIIEQQGALPFPVALLVMRGAASALAYAHEQRIIHRDVKGANILLQRDGRPVVSDFGVARGSGDKSMTATGAVMGTPYFMSPEQCAGRVVGPQSDQYSLGVVAFQMLTGAVPFDADSLPGIMQHHWFTPVPDIAHVRADVPPELLAIINRLLAKDAKQRFASTQELVYALESIALSEKDRQWAEAMLSHLARGAAIPRVKTNPLPPLQDTIHLSHPSLPVIREAPRPRRRTPVIAGGAVAVAGLALAIFWQIGAFSTPTAASAGAPAAVPVESASVRSPLVADSLPLPIANAAAAAVESSAAPATREVPVSSPPAGSSTTTSSAAGRRATPDVATRTAPIPPSPPASPAMIRLRIDPPDAEIRIDGRIVGRGVLLDYAIPAGQRVLRVSSSGYMPFDTVLVLRAGETAQLGRRVLGAAAP